MSTRRDIPNGPQKGSKTAVILGLHEEGYSTSEIADALAIRYQMVYNVLQRYGRTPNKVNVSSEKPTEETS